MSIATDLQIIAENIPKVYEAGKDDVWSAIVYPKRENYQYAFSRWEKTDFSVLEGIKYKVTFWMFGYNSTVEELDIVFDLSSATSINNMFYGCSGLKKIKKINFGNSIKERKIDVMFIGATSLEEVHFDGVVDTNIRMEECKKLKRVSIESIIKALAPDSTGQSLSLSAEAVNREFTTAEWDAFIAEYKPSTWSIALK